MKVGSLVRITRVSIGVPRDTIGLITSIAVSDSGFEYYMIQMCGIEVPRRWIGRDLEVIDESR